jgi:hypothetical protein
MQVAMNGVAGIAIVHCISRQMYANNDSDVNAMINLARLNRMFELAVVDSTERV